MTGVNNPGHGAGGWEPEAGAASGSSPGAGASGGDPDGGDQDAFDSDRIDDIFEGEIVDAVEGDELATGIIDGESPDINEVKTALAQRDEYLDSLRRLQAEFENYRKRVTKQQSDQTARAALSLVDKLLPVLDTLDLAVTHLGDADSTDGRALLAVSSQLRDVLAKEGLERIDPTGETFDPNAHEAVGHLPADEEEGDQDVSGGAGREKPAGVGSGNPTGEPVVAQVMRPGYLWRGAVVRPAMVMVRG
jgi:molecular chaperone GrpE (heat shock protein)